MKIEVIDFERLIHAYLICRDFGEIYSLLIRDQRSHDKNLPIVNDFLIRFRNLYILDTSFIELIWELHAGGAVVHFSRANAVILVKGRFYLRSIEWNISRSYITLPSLASG